MSTNLFLRNIPRTVLSVIVVGLFILLLGCPVSSSSDDSSSSSNNNSNNNSSLVFTLISSESDNGFDDGGTIPVAFGRKSGNTASTLSFPKLSWKNVPENTQSLLLVFHDKQSPNWHHGIWVIDTSITSIARDDGAYATTLAASTHAKISNGNTIEAVQVYYAPTPPSGTHTYVFKLYATTLSKDVLKKEVDNHKVASDRLDAIDNDSTIKPATLATSQLTGTYSAN